MTDSQKEPIRVPLGDGEEIVFRYIPAGSFRMGQRGVAEPVTEVFVEEFWMAETPVTRGQYKIMAGWCLEEMVKDDQFEGNDPELIKTEEDKRRPVTKVSWDDAGVVARWLTGDLWKRKILPQGYRVDLPSEAEWEMACRAGTETDFYSGDGEAALEEVGWFNEPWDIDPFPVKSKTGNQWGLSDCHGSVWQWCRDGWDGERETSRIIVPGDTEGADLSDEGYRALRGGSWGDTAWDCRSAYRVWHRPGYRIWVIGFRLALVPGLAQGQLGGLQPRNKPQRGISEGASGDGGAESSQKKGGNHG